jgi:hypothetical protein
MNKKSQHKNKIIWAQQTSSKEQDFIALAFTLCYITLKLYKVYIAFSIETRSIPNGK